MEQYKQEFTKFMILCETLEFGDFVTKGGRETPFFVNTGSYRTEMQLKQLGTYCVRAVHAALGEGTALLFEPVYKDTPLRVAASTGVSELYEREIGYVVNRKKVKDHGGKGILLGVPIKDSDKIVVIEDATMAEISIEGTMPITRAQGNAGVLGPVVSVDRCEGSKGKKSAFSEVSEHYGIKATMVITMKEVIEHLYRREVNGEVIVDDVLVRKTDAYYREYGAEKD